MRRQELDRLRALILRGLSWRAAARMLGYSVSHCHVAAHAEFDDLPCRRRPLDKLEAAAITAAIQSGQSYRAVARRFGRSVSVVHRLARRLIDEQCADLDFTPPPTCRPHRCPSCRRKITTTSCLACAASRTKNDNGRTDSLK